MEFPELYERFEDGIPDLRIHLRSINLLEGKIDENATYSFKSQENKFYVHVKSVAFYEISNGINITIYPYQDALISDIRVYCLSNAFAAALHQRKIMPLHAGAIIIDDKLSLIMGNTGSGKSTLLFYLMQKGYKVFSDDVVVVLNKKASNETRATSSYPMMKLWKHQMTCMGLDNMQQVRSGVEKFDIHARRIEKIIILKVVSGITTCAVRKLKGVESVFLLFNQIYRKEYLNRAEYFSSLSLLSSMVNNIPCYEINRPMFHSTEIELANLFTKI
jgi:hypothetical protein